LYLKQKPQGEIHLRWQVKRLIPEADASQSRYYASPSGGALNTTWVYVNMAFICTCLLSRI